MDQVANVPTKRTQQRGRARQAALVQACRALLRTMAPEMISLTDVADAAGIPRSSAYHFFTDVIGVYEAAAGEMESELKAWLRDARDGGFADWRQVVTAFVLRGAAFFAANIDAMRLLIGPTSPAIIKLKDRQNDLAVAGQLRDHVATLFELPELADTPELFFRGIEIADLFFGLSVIRHDRITGDYADEAARATCAYLALYLPAILPLTGSIDRTPDVTSCSAPRRRPTSAGRS